MSRTTPQTELEAVNAMLHDLGDRPVNDILGTTRLDVSRAIATLDQVGRQVQTRGWWFNEEIVSLIVDSSGYYNVPGEICRIDKISGGPASGTNGPVFLVVRDGVLYDTQNATDVFTGGASVKLDVVRLLAWDSLPSSAKDYIAAAASIRNQSRAMGASSISSELKEYAASAWATLHAEDLRNRKLNQTTSSHFIGLMYNR